MKKLLTVAAVLLALLGTMLLALPVYHVFGMLASVIAITNGGHLVLIPNPRPLTSGLGSPMPTTRPILRVCARAPRSF